MTTVLAIDPGRAKCGVAVVSEPRVIHRSIVSRDDIVESVQGLLREHSVDRIIVGDGTGGRDLADSIIARTSLPVELVNERHSSERARARYLRENPPKGLLRLVPIGLRTPSHPYDDYVAVILAEDYLRLGSHDRP